MHGDLKCENALVTSWSWVFLTDFASYKPTRLPADNPVRLNPQCSCHEALSWEMDVGISTTV